MRPGSVEVVAPRGVPRAVIDDFVESKSRWIKGKLNLFLSVKGPVSLEEPAEGSVLWLFGEPLELRAADGDISPVINPPVLSMGVSWFSRKKFGGWLDGMLLERVNSTAEAFSRETGTVPHRIRLGNARTRWGSCSARGVVMINRRLVHAPAQIIDYIVLHELTHLIHRNHSAAFWRELARHVPDIPRAKKWLRLEGALLI